MTEGGTPPGSTETPTRPTPHHSAAAQRQSGVDSRGLPALVRRRITNQDTWDHAVLQAGSGLLQSWRWGEFKKQAGWTPVRLLLTHPTGSGDNHSNGTGTAPAIGAQVLFRKLPRLPLPISIAYVPRGPLYFSDTTSQEPLEHALWRAIGAEARNRGSIFLKVEPNLTLDGPSDKR